MRRNGRFDVVVFPLKDAVLFPGVSLPLRLGDQGGTDGSSPIPGAKVAEEIRSRGWPIAVSWVTPESEEMFRLQPVCGAGKIEVLRCFPDGQADLVVRGDRRIRLVGLVQQSPYLVMEAEEVEEKTCVDAAEPLVRSAFGEIKDRLKLWSFLNETLPTDEHPERQRLFDSFDAPGELSDFFAYHFLRRMQDKQGYLEVVDPVERMAKLGAYLETEIRRLSRKAVRSRDAVALH